MTTGSGTWFSTRLTLSSQGSLLNKFNYDDEPDMDVPFNGTSYALDQEEFPRNPDDQPEWLQQKIALGRAAL